MCTFNGGRFLRPQLESIALQSRVPCELVICDDRSSDDTHEIVRDFSRSTAFPVRFAVNRVNLGSTKNFEQAIGQCSGQIVALADQDDVWYAHKLERIRDTFATSGIVAAFSDADLIDEESTNLGSRLWPTFGFSRSEQKTFMRIGALPILIKHPVVTGACMAFRKEYFATMMPIPSNEIHDQWMSFLLATRGRIEMIPEPLLQYRRHRKQQFGPGPSHLYERISAAKRGGKDFYLNELERFRQLYKRLNERDLDFPEAENVRQEILGKLRHLEHRAELPASKVARIPKIARETLNRGYWRYSAGGWASIAKDFVMR